MSKRYEVLRHGGRRTDKPRIIFATNELSQAESEYLKQRELYRQGGIALVDNTEKKILKTEQIGCWRTRP